MATLTNHDEARQQRLDYVNAFNTTMVEIWKEQVVKLGVIDTGNLYKYIKFTAPKIGDPDKISSIELTWNMPYYGVYQDRGTGREVPVGNPGDIGRPKIRERRPWLSKKYYSSFCRIRDFFAENLGEEFCAAIPRILGESQI